MSLIELQNITKTYHLGDDISVDVLKGISLKIEVGEMVALTGASGSGKSTLMNILGCLDRPTSGKFLFEGVDLSTATRDQRAQFRNKKMGFVFQSFNLLPRTTALDNVLMPLTYATDHPSIKECRRRAVELLTRFGLEERIDHEPSQLSGGQQQRVAIARALINHPPILFADEPTGNLDSKTGRDVLEMFKRLNEEDGITIILVTHDSGVAAAAKRVIHMADGMITDRYNVKEGETAK